MPDTKYRALARSGRALVFDEPLHLLFLKNGFSDTDRQNCDIMATLRVGNEKQSNASGGGAASWSSRISAGEAKAYISKPGYDGPPIRQGDKIRKNIGTDDAPRYILWEVRGVDDRDPQDTILNLSEV